MRNIPRAALAASALALTAAFAFGGENTPLQKDLKLSELQPDTSVFLLVDLTFPDDGLATYSGEGEERIRQDTFQDGARIAETEINAQKPFCVIRSREDLADRSRGRPMERTKHFQIKSVTRVVSHEVQGLALALESIQDTALKGLVCLPRKGEPAESLTIGIVESTLGKEGEERLAFLPPLMNVPSPPARNPAGIHFREALTDHAAEPQPEPTPSEKARNLEDTHKAFLNYLKALKRRLIPESPAAPAQ